MLTGGYLSKLVLLATAVANGSIRDEAGFSRLRFVQRDEIGPLRQLALELGILGDGIPLQIRETGLEIARVYSETRTCASPFRLLLATHIKKQLPSWAYLIPAGRREAVSAMSKDLESCFLSAGLLQEDPDENVVAWWTDMATFIRSVSAKGKTAIGSRGEEHSIHYERERTGRKPKWISFESNYAGYDLLSVVSATDFGPRPIEVKSSTRPRAEASFYVTENEWDVARFQMETYHFHLWSLGGKVPELADIPASAILPHIPQNCEAGHWKTVEIPFRVFASCFKPTGAVPAS